jgi:hypothetical protein
MTNSPFDEIERPLWTREFVRDQRFSSALRIDPLLVGWDSSVSFLNHHGYSVEFDPTERCFGGIRHFLDAWTARIQAKYVMTSLGPDFNYPSEDRCTSLLEKAILPHCRDAGVPLALMLGVKRGVNPELSLAGDGIGSSQLSSVQHLCARYPANKFLVTVLSRENQHELCVLARKFRNLHIFGCWWFTNVPSIIEEITRMRIELIGLSVTPQHSDSRILDQLIYKWRHTREVISRVLVDKYCDLSKTGWVVTDEDICRDVRDLFGGAFHRFCSMELPR